MIILLIFGFLKNTPFMIYTAYFFFRTVIYFFKLFFMQFNALKMIISI